MITAIYLLLLELFALFKQRLGYFRSLSRLVNLITPVLILINLFDHEESPTFWTIQTWAALTIWFRFLLRLKTFSGFSFIVKMIVECASDMMPFMAIFLISLFAFSSTNGTIKEILIL